jgi:ketosteroid isomerase-like protein
MAEQENVQRMQDLYAAFGRGDIATILANCSEDIDWGTETTASEVPWYRIRHGREGVADFFSTLEREVDFRQFEPRVFAGAGDQVLVHVDIEYQLKKNGRGAQVGSLHEYTFRDGAVSRFRAYEDTAAVRDAWSS